MKKFILYSILFFFTLLLFTKSIRNSKHNLASSGPGSIKSSETSMLCIFCHTSHSAAGYSSPLWNREKSNVQYTLYNSSTLYSTLDQPDGTSKLCLSCHDGNIALGHLRNRANEFSIANSESGKIPVGRPSNLKKNISDDHPISFNSSLAVSSSPEIKHPLPGDSVKYDKFDKLQCTTCHDPHNDDYAMFLVKDSRNGSLCKSCHEPVGYAGITTHDISGSSWNGSGRDPWPHTDYLTVGENSCGNCHRSHNAKGNERLLSSNLESKVCLICHDGNTGIDIKTEVKKNFSHNVEMFNNIHDPTENILTASIHTQCVDCHDPHRANSLNSIAPGINGRLVGVSGMNIGGSIISESQNEYEVCFKCHGQDRYSTGTIRRQYQNSNIRVAFDPANSSFHGVTSVGTAMVVPSLRPGWNSSSRLYCTDCHNSNNARKNGGSGPNGPHGSTHEHLLESRYLVSTSMPYQQSNYDMCWKCHRPEVVMAENFSTFKYHKKHIDGENTPCSVCHDPHGSRQNVGLINFDTSAVFPNLNGELKFEVIGNKGYCYLQCHGEDHSPEDYER